MSDFLELVGLVALRLIRVAAFMGDVLVALMYLAPIPSGCTKERAYIASMKTDLRNLASAQEAYFADHAAYATTTGHFSQQSRYWPSTGVTVVVEQATATGWRGAAVHRSMPNYRCAIVVGDAPPPHKNMVDAEPICWKP